MIQYHGTPISGTKEQAMMFLCGRHALVSWISPAHLETVKECSQSFIIDNGAFTFWENGKRLDLNEYANWCRMKVLNHPGFDWAIIPDIIDGTEKQNDSLLDLWPNDIPGAPVYHLHESLDRAKRLAADWPIVCLGSSGEWPNPGTRSWWKRMNEIRKAFCNSKGVPKCKLHGLRMMNPKIFSHLPLSSADSTNCGQNGLRNGKRLDKSFTNWQGATLTAWRLERHNSSATWKIKKQS